MVDHGTPEPIVSRYTQESLSHNGARLEVRAPALGRLAAAYGIEPAPERLIVVDPGELRTQFDFMAIPASGKHQKIFIQGDGNPYNQEREFIGHRVFEQNEAGTAMDEKPNDLVVVTDDLTQWGLKVAAARALRNHPHLNKVVHRDLTVRQRVDKAGRGAVVAGFMLGVPGTLAKFYEVPYTEWMPHGGLLGISIGFAAVTLAYNVSPRRAPDPNVDAFESPLVPVEAASGKIL